jgi:predicted MFS family arabinose efflux permease
MVAFSQLFCTFPLYLHQIYRFPESRIGGMLAVNTVAIVLFEMVLLHALRKRPALLLIGFGSLLIGLGFGMLPLGRGFIFAAFTVLIWTLGEILVIPMTATATANRAGLGGAGRYMGMLSMTFSLANFFAPMAGNGIYKALGGDTLWLIVGATGMMSAIGFYSQRGRFSTLPMAGRR